MASESLWSSIKEESRQNYIAVFEKQWPGWMAGIFIAILALLIFLWDSPWGIAGGYRNWGDWFYYLVGVSDKRPFPPWLTPLSVSNIGLMIGAFASALMGRQFAFRRTTGLEYGKGMIGGILMGFGAALAKGCNVGGFYSAIGVFSMGGYMMMIGLGGGAYIGLRILLWEMENITPKIIIKKPVDPDKKGIDWDKVQPFIGGAVLISVIIIFYIYSAFDLTKIGGLLFFGLLIGLTMHRSRFCFVRAFRCPFMTGESDMVKVVAMSLMIYGAGSAVIKWNFLQDAAMGVHHPFWFGSLAGGLIFGVGMLLAGGCASSTLWRIGEGHTKLMVTLVAFALTNSMAFKVLGKYNLQDKLGKGLFMPDVFTWQVTMPLFFSVLLIWAFVAIWNEEVEKFVIF